VTSTITPESAQSEELVVLLDDDGRRIGTALKAEIHDDATPLHFAFSCYLFDDDGRVLLTRRALDKRAFPGIWTNSFCGHPAPDESVEDAVVRRARKELGVEITDVRCVLTDFRYRATDASGVVENELCPVFAARAASPVVADPAEIMDSAWVPWDQLSNAARIPWAISPWAAEQIPLLEAAGVGRV
jgi:isopentenyl-diphosphate Delta-isomerase